ncbi:MAG TPA: transcription elongation factor GreA [Chitinophagaceae bacterium]|jgi:transcription elongation factor GreA|nr:transcription elongation factor GreA [Chitinophagaceae bacterium]
MAEVTYVTRETLDQMQKELTRLKTKGRAEIARAIAEAREKGDLKENAEYDAAKEAQGYHEARIAQLEAAVMSARILDMKDVDTSRVSVLSTVTIMNMKTQKTMTYQLVSENEANIKAGKLSVVSPIGKGLLGKKKGEVAEVNTPTGLLNFRVENISI